VGHHADGRDFPKTYAALCSTRWACRTAGGRIPIGGTSARARAVIANSGRRGPFNGRRVDPHRAAEGRQILATLSAKRAAIALEICVVNNEDDKRAFRPWSGLRPTRCSLGSFARTPEGKQAYLKIARQIDPSGYTDTQYDELYDFYFGPKSNRWSWIERAPSIPKVYVENMKSNVGGKKLDAMMAADKLVDARLRRSVYWQ